MNHDDRSTEAEFGMESDIRVTRFPPPVRDYLTNSVGNSALQRFQIQLMCVANLHLQPNSRSDLQYCSTYRYQPTSSPLTHVRPCSNGTKLWSLLSKSLLVLSLFQLAENLVYTWLFRPG